MIGAKSGSPKPQIPRHVSIFLSTAHYLDEMAVTAMH